MMFEQLLDAIAQSSKKSATLLIGIDGGGGAGKSTLAEKIKVACDDVTIVHMDDFYLPSSQRIDTKPANKPIGADFDWERLARQVLEPLLQEKTGRYQRYDWETDTLAEWHAVPVGGIVIVEGVYAIRRELATHYDLTIWIETPRSTRLLRGLERDGEAARDLWENQWMVAEDLYREQHEPHKRADFIIDGTP
ncbi:uridine kinase [Brevibacillus sp. AG162]|uniref:uridine kinase family protein n=1 Tax=Brevibacillus sp. AG162 TaxID=2572910 RepID=UPI00114DD7EB|nr:uridine kinase [Brevibacillus sp. AG162]